MKLHFVTSGLRTTTQDLGRPGHTHVGIPTGGVLDRGAMRYANHLVGTPRRAGFGGHPVGTAFTLP